MQQRLFLFAALLLFATMAGLGHRSFPFTTQVIMKSEKYDNLTRAAEVFSSVGKAPAPCVEATILTAGDPVSNPAPSGPVLCVIAPLSASHFLSLSLY